MKNAAVVHPTPPGKWFKYAVEHSVLESGRWASNINKNEKCWKFYLENFTHFLWKYVMKLVLLKLKLCRYVGCFNRADGWFLMVSLGGSGNGDGWIGWW